MANANWTCTVYGADIDSGTPPYHTVATSTISAYTGATNKVGYIVAPQQKWAWERFEQEYITGWKSTKSRRRIVFEVEFYPATFAAGGDQDLSDIEDIATVLAKPYLWIRISTPEYDYPRTASTAYPVVATDWQEAVNKSTGFRGLTVTFEHRAIFDSSYTSVYA